MGSLPAYEGENVRALRQLGGRLHNSPPSVRHHLHKQQQQQLLSASAAFTVGRQLFCSRVQIHRLLLALDAALHASGLAAAVEPGASSQLESGLWERERWLACLLGLVLYPSNHRTSRESESTKRCQFVDISCPRLSASGPPETRGRSSAKMD